jgi:hypothetical protein
MSRRIGRGGRKGQTHTATPTLRSYDIPPASAVTITRPDGTVEVVPAQKPKTTPKPNRRTRAKRSPVVCAMCGQPITGKPARSAEQRHRGKPVHRPGACPEEKPKTPTKPDPASTLPRARGGSPRPYKNLNTRAVKPADWLKVTCPRCGAAPGTPCTGVRTIKGTAVSPKVPHQEHPQVVRRALAAAQRAKKQRPEPSAVP